MVAHYAREGGGSPDAIRIGELGSGAATTTHPTGTERRAFDSQLRDSRELAAYLLEILAGVDVSS